MMKKIWTLLLAVCMVTVMMPAMAFAEGEGSTTPTKHTVDFGSGSWTVGDVTVTADKSGEQPLTMDTVITLTGFDADTMTAQVAASNGFKIGLKVTEGKTSLSAINGDGVLPEVLTFSVVAANNNPPAASAGKLTFTCKSNAVTGGNVFYKLNNTDDFMEATASDNQYAPIALENSDTSITIKLAPNEGYNLDTVRGVSLSVNGKNKFETNGANASDFISESGYTFNLSDLVGSEGSISNSSFELEFGFGREAEQPPQPSVDTDNIYFDVDGTDGSIYYQLADSKDNLNPEGWISVGIDSENSNQYTPVAKSTFQNSTGKVFFRIEGGESKHLDVDSNFQIKKDGQCIYNVFGTYNGDSNYEGPVQPADKTGLKDMYENMDDCYIIPVDTSYLTGEGARSIEFRWIDMIPISVEVDAASQYLIASGKTTIGIATGQGFGVSVQNGSNVSIPLLGDSNQNGEGEPNQDGNNESIPLLEDSNQDGEGEPSQDSDGDKYLIDLNVNRDYFIPEFSINDNSYETYDTGSGNNDFTNIAVAIPAEDFKAMINSSKETNDGKGKITIHLTVDKNVPVNQGDSQDVQASFNMIDDGTIPGVEDLDDASIEKAMESLDNVSLSAREENEIADDEVRAFDITMSIGETSETDSLVPIDISIAGDFDGDENSYKVIREHEGEASTELDCTVKKGGDDEKDVLTFSTDKFSKFTIICSSSSGGSSGGGGGSSGGGGSAGGTGGGGTAPSETEDSNITNSGSETGGVASTTLDLNISAKHEEGRTTAAVDPALGDRLVENAVKNNSTSIVLDLTGLGNDGSSSSELSFSPATFYGIASKTSASVTFQTASAEVIFDRKSVAAVSSQAGTDGYLSFIAETTENSKKKVEVNLKIKTSNGPITNFNGGNVTVTVPVNDALASKNLTCVYIDDKGKLTKMGGALLAGKKLFSFNTTHFSTYAILEEAEADALIAKQNIKVGTAGVKLYTAKGGKLRVKASAKNATGYKVYYKKSSWKNYKTYTKGKVKTLDKTFKKLSKGKYTVKVKAYYKDYNGTGDVTWGKLSSAKKITVRR